MHRVFRSTLLVGVVFRYVLLKPLPWAGPLSCYLMALMTLLGAGGVMRRGGHIAFTFFVDRLRGPAKLVPFLMSELLVVAFALLMGYLALDLIAMPRTHVDPALKIPVAWLYAGFPVFALLLVLGTLEHAAGILGAISREKEAP